MDKCPLKTMGTRYSPLLMKKKERNRKDTPKVLSKVSKSQREKISQRSKSKFSPHFIYSILFYPYHPILLSYPFHHTHASLDQV